MVLPITCQGILNFKVNSPTFVKMDLGLWRFAKELFKVHNQNSNTNRPNKIYRLFVDLCEIRQHYNHFTTTFNRGESRRNGLTSKSSFRPWGDKSV